MSDVYAEIKQERARQDEQWGGPEHDDALSIAVWLSLLAKHSGRLHMAVSEKQPTRVRRQLIVLAALCVALIESFDRGNRAS